MDNDLIYINTSGYSMWPFLKQGEKLMVKKIPVENLKRGDLVLYRAGDRLVCHRLMKKAENKEEVLFYVRGDNSLSPPECIAKDRYVGKAVAVVKNDKIFSLETKMRGHIGGIIVAVAPLVSAGNSMFRPYYQGLRNIWRGLWKTR